MAEPRDPTARSAPGRGPVTEPPAELDVRRLVSRVVDAVYWQPPDARRPTAAPDPGTSGSTPSSPSGPPPAVTPADRPSHGGVSVAVGADHGGFALKQQIARTLADQGYAVQDCGTGGPEAVDYPDFAHAVARLVADGRCTWGIIVDGAGIGSCMVANKVPGVRAAMCYDLSTARNSREHNHANVLTLGARLIGDGLALEIVGAWLATPWGPGRHAARVAKIDAIERSYLGSPAGEGAR